MHQERGFTLVEILIAVALIGLALALMVSGVNWSSRTSAMLQNKLLNDMREIETAVQRYGLDHPTGPAPTMATLAPLYLSAPYVPEELGATGVQYQVSSDNHGRAVSARLQGGSAAYPQALDALFGLSERFPKKVVLCLSLPAPPAYCDPMATSALTDRADGNLAVEPDVDITYWVDRRN